MNKEDTCNGCGCVIDDENDSGAFCDYCSSGICKDCEIRGGEGTVCQTCYDNGVDPDISISTIQQ